MEDLDRDQMIRVLDGRYPDFTQMYPGRSLSGLDEDNLLRLYNCENTINIFGFPSLDTYQNKARKKHPNLFREYPEFSFSDLNEDELKDMTVGDSLDQILSRRSDVEERAVIDYRPDMMADDILHKNLDGEEKRVKSPGLGRKSERTVDRGYSFRWNDKRG